MTTLLFFEAVVRYADFFKDNAQFFAQAIQWFFSVQGIKHGSKAIASPALNLFLRLTEKFRHQNNIFPQQADTLSRYLMEIIDKCETGLASNAEQ